MKKIDKQMAPNIATIRRANVVFSPVSASLVDSFIPRKFTGLSVIGALVPAEEELRHRVSVSMSN